MSFCGECGTEVDSQKFCPECGTQIQDDATESDEPDAPTADAEADDGFNTTLGITAVLMGVLVGAVVAFAFSNIGGASILFVVTVAGVGYWLYKNAQIPSEAVGSGLYVFALWLILSPIMFYIPVIGGANTDTAGGTGTALGGIMGMVIYGFIALILAVVAGAVGYFSKKRAKKKLGEVTV